MNRETELNVGRRVTARNEQDTATRAAAARIAAIARNASALSVLESTRRNTHATSLTYHGHNGRIVDRGSGNFFKRRPRVFGCHNCGARSTHSYPGGSCPGRPYHSEPTWEDWSAAAKQNGQWESELTKLGYDFTI